MREARFPCLLGTKHHRVWLPGNGTDPLLRTVVILHSAVVLAMSLGAVLGNPKLLLIKYMALEFALSKSEASSILRWIQIQQPRDQPTDPAGSRPIEPQQQLGGACKLPPYPDIDVGGWMVKRDDSVA